MLMSPRCFEDYQESIMTLMEYSRSQNRMMNSWRIWGSLAASRGDLHHQNPMKTPKDHKTTNHLYKLPGGSKNKTPETGAFTTSSVIHYHHNSTNQNYKEDHKRLEVFYNYYRYVVKLYQWGKSVPS